MSGSEKWLNIIVHVQDSYKLNNLKLLSPCVYHSELYSIYWHCLLRWAHQLTHPSAVYESSKIFTFLLANITETAKFCWGIGMKCIKICLLLVINKDRCLFVGHSRLLICKLPVLVNYSVWLLAFFLFICWCSLYNLDIDPCWSYGSQISCISLLFVVSTCFWYLLMWF